MKDDVQNFEIGKRHEMPLPPSWIEDCLGVRPPPRVVAKVDYDKREITVFKPTLEEERDSWRGWAIGWAVVAAVMAVALLVSTKARAAVVPSIAATVSASNALSLATRSKAAPDPLVTERRELAAETFEYLRKHCVPLEEDPMQWQYAGCYDLHLTARKLWNGTPLRDIAMPVSDYERGGYRPYFSPLVYITHELIMSRIEMLIRYGRSGIPARRGAK